jgi:RNA polymerase sigma-70 factor (ECF subfamily)
MKTTLNRIRYQARDSSEEELSYIMTNNVLIRAEDNVTKFSKIYEEHAEALLRFCLFKLSNKEKAVDLVSDTFVRAWQYLLRGNIIENEKSFLYTTARHLIIDEYRKKKNISLELLISSGFEVSIDGEHDVYNHIDNNILMQEVNRLPVSYRSIILMRYVDDFSVSYISKVVGRSENNVSVKIHRGLIKLREILLVRYGSSSL